MSAVPKPVSYGDRSPSRPPLPRGAARRSHPPRSQGRANPAASTRVATNSAASGVVQPMPKSVPWPLWLRLMGVLQQMTSIASFSLVVSALVVYGWTVYSQRLWDREYRRLEGIQQQERQITTANEMLKSQLAQEAEDPSTGLVKPSMDQAIFLQPAPQRPQRSPAPVQRTLPSGPVGY